MTRHAEPLQSLLSRIMELECKPIAFGRSLARLFEDQVEAGKTGVEGPGKEAPPEVAAIRQPSSGVGGSYAIGGEEVDRDWLRRVLADERGTVAALPPTADDQVAGVGTVLRLMGTEVGAATWWLDRLRGTAFSREDSYKTGRGTAVYRLVGDPEDGGWGWFPTGTAYGLPRGCIGRHIALGLTVELEHVLPTATLRHGAGGGTEESSDALARALADAAALRLEAARVNAAPAVLACVLAHAPNEAASPPPRALVVASELHAFRLRDLLLARTQMGAWENVAYADAQLQRAGTEVALLLRRLADARLLCLHPTTEHVVFVPQLDADVDVWRLGGVGLRTAQCDLVEGVPRITGFDTRLCRRVAAEQTEYSADAAWLLHGALLLGAATVEFDEHTVLPLRAGFKEAGWTGALNQAEPLPGFATCLRHQFVHGRRERDAVPRAVAASLPEEFEALIATGTEAGRFKALLEYVLGPRVPGLSARGSRAVDSRSCLSVVAA